jgi:PPOX class probable F420-dependent enzyme
LRKQPFTLGRPLGASAAQECAGTQLLDSPWACMPHADSGQDHPWLHILDVTQAFEARANNGTRSLALGITGGLGDTSGSDRVVRADRQSGPDREGAPTIRRSEGVVAVANLISDGSSHSGGEAHQQPRRLLDPVRGYLEAARCAVLASLRADGEPQQVVVHYLLEADHLLVNGSAGRRWVANLRRDPRASLMVHDADRPLHWVGIRGRAEGSAHGSAAVRDAMTMARRYGEDPADYQHLQRVSFKIVPHHVFEYGADREDRQRPGRAPGRCR